MKHAIGYARASTTRQEKSIPEQKATILEWAARNGRDVVRWFEDAGISGDEFDARPGFQQMLKYVAEANGSFEEVLVWDKSRFGRPENPKEAAAYEWQIERFQKRIVYVATGRVSDSSTGALFQDLAENAQAGAYLANLSKEIARHQVQNARDGVRIGGKPPFGYDLLVLRGDRTPRYRVRYLPAGRRNRYVKELRDPATGTVKEVIGPDSPLPRFERTDRSKLVIGDPAQVEVVREVFSLYSTGHGYKAIVRRLNGRGVPSASGLKWGILVIREMLSNPNYTGALVMNRRCFAKYFRPGPEGIELRDREKKGRIERNDPSRWIVVEDAHEPIVSKEVFDAAQQRMRAHVRVMADGRKVGISRGPGGIEGRYLLSNVGYCALCGCKYHGKATRKGGSEIVSFSYVCSSYYLRGDCRPGSVPLAKIEKPLLDLLRQVYFSLESEAELANEIRKELALEFADHGEEIERLQKRKTALRAKIDALVEELAVLPAAARGVVREKIEAAVTEAETVEREIARLSEAQANQVEADQAAKEVRAVIEDFRGLFEKGDRSALKEIVRTFVSRIEIYAEEGRAVVSLRPRSAFYEVGRGERNLTSPALMFELRWAA